MYLDDKEVLLLRGHGATGTALVYMFESSHCNVNRSLLGWEVEGESEYNSVLEELLLKKKHTLKVWNQAWLTTLKGSYLTEIQLCIHFPEQQEIELIWLRSCYNKAMSDLQVKNVVSQLNSKYQTEFMLKSFKHFPKRHKTVFSCPVLEVWEDEPVIGRSQVQTLWLAQIFWVGKLKHPHLPSPSFGLPCIPAALRAPYMAAHVFSRVMEKMQKTNFPTGDRVPWVVINIFYSCNFILGVSCLIVSEKDTK